MKLSVIFMHLDSEQVLSQNICLFGLFLKPEYHEYDDHIFEAVSVNVIPTATEKTFLKLMFWVDVFH